MKFLLDTNLLTRSAQVDHPQHDVARDSIRVLLLRGDEVHIVPQNLYEFWAVATRPAGENGLGMTPAEAHAEARRLREMFVLLLDERGIFRRWQDLTLAHAVKGKTSHDVRLVAAMIRHQVEHLLTFNSQHFQRFQFIRVHHPDDIVGAAGGRGSAY